MVCPAIYCSPSSRALRHDALHLPNRDCEGAAADSRGEAEVSERIHVRADIGAARAKQAEIAERFEHCFASGLAVVGVEGTDYLLGVIS